MALNPKKFNKDRQELDTDPLIWGSTPANITEALNSLKADINSLEHMDFSECTPHFEGTPPKSLYEAIEKLCYALTALQERVALNQLTIANWNSNPESITSAINRIASEVATLKGGPIS